MTSPSTNEEYVTTLSPAVAAPPDTEQTGEAIVKLADSSLVHAIDAGFAAVSLIVIKPILADAYLCKGRYNRHFGRRDFSASS